MPADNDARGIRAVRRALASDPGHRAPAFVDDRRDRYAGTKVVVDDGDGEILRDERRRHEGKIALVESAPVAAVDEDERSACASRRHEEVERLLRSAPVTQIEPRR